MPYAKYYLLTFLIYFSLNLYAQEFEESNSEVIEIQIQTLIRKGLEAVESRDYFNGKENYQAALQIAHSRKDKKNEGIIYTKLAEFHLLVDEDDCALESLNKAFNIQREIRDSINMPATYDILGLFYSSKKEYGTAVAHHKSAIKIYNQKGLESFTPKVLLNIAKIHIKLKAYSLAKESLERAKHLSKKYNQTKIYSKTLINYGKTLHNLGENEAALKAANEGLSVAFQNNLKTIVNDAYIVLSEIYEKNNNYKISNAYLRKHIKLSDSILNSKLDNAFSDKRAKYFKDTQNAKTQKVIDKSAARDQLMQIITILGIALITILSLLTLSLYKNNNIRKKTNNVLHEKNTELILAKEKAELASKTRANFLSTVTHELRTPLYAVTGITTLLLDENPKPRQIKHLKSLKFSGDYLLTFINDILQINKIEANKVEVHFELFNLKKKIQNIIAALKNTTDTVEIHFEYEKGLFENFISDQIKISQILINLIGNAIKFTEYGDIWVRVYKVTKKGNTYTLGFEVEDNGIGISEEKQENMFDCFYQGSIQINRKYGGTGLGLSIVSGLIEILKGKISVKSELDKGSIFVFDIPLEYAQKDIISTKENEFNEKLNQLDLKNFKILIIEDNKINQMVTKKILSKINLKSDIIDNGEDAVERVKKVKYDLVLMDIHMPGISGIEATKLIRKFDKQLKIFALTAVTLEDKMQEFENAGFNDIISKPFKQEDFEEKLYKALSETQKMDVLV